ncbi:MAG: carboxypeptidase-like regulatory domain-containing protein [Reichenbachiella sp.]
MRYLATLIIILSIHEAFAQEVKIHGAIVDSESLESLQGVHIFSSIRIGEVSDIDGNFNISVGYSDTLHFSMIGYDSLTLIIDDSLQVQDMLIAMKPRSIELDGVSINAKFQAQSILISPEKSVHRITGIKYPENPRGENYRLGVGGSIFMPATAVYRLVSKSYKEEKRAYVEGKQGVQDALFVERVKKKMRDTLALNGEKIDDYYMIDFIHYLGLDLTTVDHMYVYDLSQKSKGQVINYLKTLDEEKE